MLTKAKVGATILLLIVVAYIFVLPAFDLNPTALRAMRDATLVFTGIAAAASVLNAAKPAFHFLAVLPLDWTPSALDLTDLTCSRLC